MGANTKLLSDKVDHLIRVGRVVGREEGSMRLRVEIPDAATGAMTTMALQTMTTRAKGDLQYDLPDMDDQVLCLFMPNGKEVGFVLGSMYPDTQPPPVDSGDKWHRTFEDGTWLEYDRKAHVLTARVKGGVTIEADQPIVLKAPVIQIDANIEHRGDWSQTGSHTASGTIIDSGGNTNHHSH